MLKQISETNVCEEIDFNVFLWEIYCICLKKRIRNIFKRIKVIKTKKLWYPSTE